MDETGELLGSRQHGSYLAGGQEGSFGKIIILRVLILVEGLRGLPLLNMGSAASVGLVRAAALAGRGYGPGG